MPAKAFIPDVSDIAALASVLKNTRARKAFQAAVKKGQSPVLSLTAAISASLVSAAAKEEEFDPLAGLAAVDDLSGFGEDCLPGSKYEIGDDHDHDALARDHDGHDGHASYLADPFASRFANIYARDHDGHNDHGAVTSGHEQNAGAHSHDEAHAASQTAHATHQQGHGSHQDHAGAQHQTSAAGDHEHHAQAGSEDHAAHGSHGAGHDMAAHEAAGHGDMHSAHASASAENIHADHAGAHEDHDEHAEAEADVIDLDQAMGALTENDHDVHESASTDGANDAPVEAAEEEHHHHMTLADMGAPPAEDLAAAQALPII